MKTLVIPDIHLKPWIFERASLLLADSAADKIVCLMDIPDDWNREFDIELYEETFDAAIRFAKTFPDTLWCWGNHDLSYVWGMTETGYSWFAQNTVSRKLIELKEAIPDWKQLAYLHRIDNVLFSHGGLTDFFVWKHVPAKDYDNIDEAIRVINNLDCEDMWNNDSPIWFRPQYNRDIKMYKPRKLLQVVGHTPVEGVSRDRNVVSCDVFSTYRNGAPIGTESFPVIDTVTWDISQVK